MLFISLKKKMIVACLMRTKKYFYCSIIEWIRNNRLKFELSYNKIKHNWSGLFNLLFDNLIPVASFHIATWTFLVLNFMRVCSQTLYLVISHIGSPINTPPPPPSRAGAFFYKYCAYNTFAMPKWGWTFLLCYVLWVLKKKITLVS